MKEISANQYHTPALRVVDVDNFKVVFKVQRAGLLALRLDLAGTRWPALVDNGEERRPVAGLQLADLLQAVLHVLLGFQEEGLGREGV